MSSFTKPIKIEVTKEGAEYKLLEGFEYYRTDDESDIIKVPEGTTTNGASVPRLFWTIYPPTGGGTKKTRYFQAAILHDYLYETGIYTRKESDKIFLEAMKAMNVSYFTRYLFYWCVRLFARSHYNKK